MKNNFCKFLKTGTLLPLLAFLALLLTAAPSFAAIGGMTIGGCIYTGESTVTYTPTGPAGTPVGNWNTIYAEDGAAAIPDAKVLIQNQHSGGAFVAYPAVDGNGCWEWTMADTKVAGTPDVTDLIVMYAAPNHSVTSREFTWDPDGRFSKNNWGVLPVLTGGPKWPGGSTKGNFIHPTGTNPKAGGEIDANGNPLSVWAIGAQDAYLMSPQKTTSALHYVFYDNFTDGNDNGPLIDWPVNGATVNVFDEHGTIVASQVTGQLALLSTDPRCIDPAKCQGGFITDDGVVFAGAMAEGYVYFTGLPGNDEYKVETDPSTVTQAANPHFTLGMAHSADICTGADTHYDYERTDCNWRQTYTEEGTHAGEIYAWPGSPGTMDGGYLTWHAIVEKLPSSIDPGNLLPGFTGTITGTLIDSTGADPLEAPIAGHGGRVPPTNARFELGPAWNRTRSAAGWGAEPDPLAPASDVIPNSRIMDGNVVLYSLNGNSPRVVGTAVATTGQDFNDPATGGRFTFTDVPPGTYGLYAMDSNLYYVMFVGAQVTLTPGATMDVPMLYERWGARSMGFVERNGESAGAGLTVKKWYKAGTTKGTSTTNANGWFLERMWWETGQMGVQYVDPVDGSTWRGKIVTEQFQDIPTIIESHPILYSWLTHNSISRSVGYATHNYFVDLQIEDIPGNVGNLIGTVFNDHFSSSNNKGDGVYGEDEDRLWQGETVELYNAPAFPGTCADLAITPGTLAGVRKTGKFSKPDAGKAGWNAPYSYPMDEIGSMHASPVLFADHATIGAPIVPPSPPTPPAVTYPGWGAAATPPADYVASAYPNIGTSASEAARFVADPNSAPMPGFYEYRDLAPGNYCVRSMPKTGYRRSPDSNVEPGGFRAVTITAGFNSRVDLGVNTTPTSTATVAAGTAICDGGGVGILPIPETLGACSTDGAVSCTADADCSATAGICNGYVAAIPEILEVIGSCSNNSTYSCTADLNCEGIAHPFGIKMAGELEGGMWDGMQAVDTNPTSLLFMDAIAMFGSPVEVRDGNDYFVAVGYQGDTRCHSYNNRLHPPGRSMLETTDTNYDSFACRSTINLSSKPELERRFAPGANRYIGNAVGYPWLRQDPSIPAHWGGQSVRSMTTIHNPAYESMELGIGVSQAGYKFEAAWTPLVQTTGAGMTFDICATGLTGASYMAETWSGVATVTVQDGWSPVAGAEVMGTWSTGDGKGCITDANGQCNVILEKANIGSTQVTYSVNTILPDQNAPWYAYNSNPTTGPLAGTCRTSVIVFAPTVTPPPPPPPPQCNDGLDNDGDGLIDYPEDDGCASLLDNDEYTPPPPPPVTYQCSNGVDDDGDGLIDFGEDPGCDTIFDDNEYNAAPPTSGPVSLHVAAMSGANNTGGEKFMADASVTVRDNLSGLVSGATADFSYTWIKEGEAKTKNMSCITNGSGKCTATTGEMEGTNSVSIILTGVGDPVLPYIPSDNMDEYGVAVSIDITVNQ